MSKKVTDPVTWVDLCEIGVWPLSSVKVQLQIYRVRLA